MKSLESEQEVYLECEKRHIFLLLMFVGGFYGAYTYSCRGGVFCNAQTANFVLFSMKLGQGEWLGALYYLIPMSAYLLGSMLSVCSDPCSVNCFPGQSVAVTCSGGIRC